MGLERVIHRIATDPSFAKSVGTDPEKTLKDAKFNLSSVEFNALESILDKFGAINLPSLSAPRLYEWYSAQLYEWY